MVRILDSRGEDRLPSGSKSSIVAKAQETFISGALKSETLPVLLCVMILFRTTANSKIRLRHRISNIVSASEETGEPFSLESTCHG
jgi:hypothetical protein